MNEYPLIISHLGADSSYCRIVVDMSCCVNSATWQVALNAETGERRVIAKRKIKIGEEVMQNVANMALLRYEYINRRCFACFRPSDKLLKCGSCHVISYCNKDCQVKDWRSHKSECKFMPNLVEHFQDDTDSVDDVLLLCRTLMGLSSNKDCKYDNDNIVLCGQDHIKSLSLGDSGKMYADNTIRVIQQVALIAKKPVGDIARLYTQFKCNNFGILDDLLKCYAAGVFPAAALLNHSCDPNCVLQFNDNNILRIIAVKEIAINEEITHSYTDLALPTESRKNKLKSVYGFDCACCRCSAGANTPSASREGLLRLLEEAATDPLRTRAMLSNNRISNLELEYLITATYSARNSREVTDEVAALVDQSKKVSLIDEKNKDAIQLLEKALLLLQGIFHPLHFEIYKVKALIFHLYLLEGMYEDAISTCKYLCTFLLICFSQIGSHPLLGLQLFTLSDLCKLVSHDYDWRSTYNWAHSIISITHDPKSAMLSRLREIVKDFSLPEIKNPTPAITSMKATDRIRVQRRLTLCNSLLRVLYRGLHGKSISNKVRQEKGDSLTEEKDKALTYGEVVCASFLQILKLIHNHIATQQPSHTPENYTFVDLGSGTGKACMTAAFEPHDMFTHVYGLEIMSELVDMANGVKIHLMSAISEVQAAPVKRAVAGSTQDVTEDTKNEDFMFLVEKSKQIVRMNSLGVTYSSLADSLGKLLGAKVYKSKVIKPYHKFSTFIQQLKERASHVFTFHENLITLNQQVEKLPSEEDAVAATAASGDDDAGKESLTDVLNTNNLATLLPLPEMHFMTCDIFNIPSNNLHNVIQADRSKTIVYCADLLFSPTMIDQLTIIVGASLAEGSYFVSLKPINSVCLQLIEESFFQMSWQKAIVYIYAVKKNVSP